MAATIAIGMIMPSCKKQNKPPINPTNTMVTTLAGPGIGGSSAGAGLASSFNNPVGVAVDSSGNVYVADSGNNVIRKISPAGVVTTLPNSGIVETLLGRLDSSIVSFNGPTGVAVDAAGNVYVADRDNNLVRMISPSGMVITLVDGTMVGEYPSSIHPSNPDDYFKGASGIAVDVSGNVYWTDWIEENISYLSPNNWDYPVVFPAAGSITCCSVTGSANGTGYNASFNNPAGVAVDASGNIYVADAGNNLIRKITFSLAPLNYEDGVVTTLAGSGAHGSDNGDSTLASFNNPTGVAVDKAGNVYVADAGNNMIRKIDPSGAVSALAGSGQPGAANGIGALATFNHPTGVAVDASGNVYVADAGNNLIRKITQ
jgi:serine/threonine-protein kinase